MDIFITNLPPQSNQNEIRIYLRDVFLKFDILCFDIFKKVGNNWANVTTPDPRKAEYFILRHGSTRGTYPLSQLVFRGSRLQCQRSNKRGQPDKLKVRALVEKEQKLRAERQNLPKDLPLPKSTKAVFPFNTLSLGTWTYNHLENLTFNKTYHDDRSGSVIFGKRVLVLYLRKGVHSDINFHCRIDIPYSILEHVITSRDNGRDPTISFTLRTPPKVFELVKTDDLHLYRSEDDATQEFGGVSIDSVSHAMQQVSISNPAQKRMRRLCQIHPKFEKVVGLCMVYRVVLPSMDLAFRTWQYLKQYSAIKHRSDAFRTAVPAITVGAIETEYKLLEKYLRDSKADQYVPFGCRFQLLALVLEGTLSPSMVRTSLLPEVSRLCSGRDPIKVAESIRQLAYELETPGFGVHASQLHMNNIFGILEDNIASLEEVEETSQNLLHGRRQQGHLVNTYKATVTPTGLLLRGPDPAISNRVLRRYEHHSDYFMRVFFADEDGVSVLHDARASQDDVYTRFRSILQEGIEVAGRRYEFLGFSHSSLHNHTAWFMAPFHFDHKFIRAADIIEQLGDFSHLHISAKCAARIGQAFSDTMFSFSLPSNAYATETSPDVVKNGYTFSDGCGTISSDLLEKIWKVLPPGRRESQPTVLQIRYKGAKGVVSLDRRLTGEKLIVRNSMTKYPARDIWNDLEICGAAYRPLTCYLNHQFIKILEDLQVPADNFLQVQMEAIRDLKMMLENPLNAAAFLEITQTGKSAKIPSLLENLYYISVSFYADPFLTEMLEIAAMTSIRDMKYRARIPLKQGMLLYGIMDESNTLKEGEVYISTRTVTEDGKVEILNLVNDRIVVTRAPALHPGDVQVARAVSCANNLYLGSLYNCVVFSQQGYRDLPSQLGGGDLDGDLFHIIDDERLIPPRTAIASGYAPAPTNDLGRPAKTDDIIDFFIEYMHSDQLGRISNMHKVLADQKPAGTRDSDCIALAELASHAVDFSKSGRPVAMQNAPKANYHIRPDFMATGPDLKLEGKGIAFAEDETDDIDDPDSVSLLDPDQSRIRYYESGKVLGILYRNIDEKYFFNYMKKVSSLSRQDLGSESLMQILHRYIDRETRGVIWDHWHEFAGHIREFYSDNILEIMYSLGPHRGTPLTELEVFSGNILGKKNRDSSRSVREANQEIRERFNRDVAAVMSRIVKGEGLGDEKDEALPRAIACFKVSFETKGWEEYERKRLRSFRYVVAGVLLEELATYHNGLRSL